MSYEVVGLLGRGGSAVVELAVDPAGRRVAAKRVPLVGSAAQIHEGRTRLRREADILRSLAHPGIVPVLDIVDDGTDLVLVLPAMAENLEERVRRLGPLPEAEIVRIGRVLLEALSAAHRSGVVHRDIKPANVLFDDGGRPALADFGAALTHEMTAGLTGAGSVLGTAMWMAPEQARGDRIGPSADVFSLAATLVFAAAGTGPYSPGPALAVLGRAARGEVVPLPAAVPTSLREALARMLSVDPLCRPSAASVLGGVGGTRSEPAASSGAAASVRAVPPAAVADRPSRQERARVLARRSWARILGDPPLRPRSRRRPWVIAAAAVTVVLVAALGAAVSGRGSPVGRAGTASSVPPPAPCVPLPFQPCGSAAPAPHTDGVSCDPGWYNLDGSAADGCESRSDYVSGTVLTDRAPVHANLVPLSAADMFPTRVAGDALHLCWGALHVTLTAPPGAAERVTVRKGGATLATAVSADGAPATAVVSKPSCIGSDSEDLTVSVTGLASTGAASASDFTLSRDAGW